MADGIASIAAPEARATTAAGPTPAPAQTGWNPFRLHGRPFFEDKNRAFWTLQSLGWGGYFLLRTLSGFANDFGWSFVIHAAMLTATGYSITLLMGASYKRLIRMREVYTWVGSILIVAVASAVFSAIETWSAATFIQPGISPQRARTSSRVPSRGSTRMIGIGSVGAML